LAHKLLESRKWAVFAALCSIPWQLTWRHITYGQSLLWRN
jgi:hypothetical protein